jgi:hypothetical protein
MDWQEIKRKLSKEKYDKEQQQEIKAHLTMMIGSKYLFDAAEEEYELWINVKEETPLEDKYADYTQEAGEKDRY